MAGKLQMSSDGAAARPALPPGVNFTCMACRVGFALADAHREHFKSDWHRYNLKRKVCSVVLSRPESGLVVTSRSLSSGVSVLG